MTRRPKSLAELAERTSRIGPGHLEPGLLSVVVFGPGQGEAVVAVLPDGSVGVVDGCREPRGADGRGDPVRELLAALAGAEMNPSLAFACLTHPHADHYGGFGCLLGAYGGRVERLWTVDLVTGHYGPALKEWIRGTWAGGDDTPDGRTLRGLEHVVDEVEKARLAKRGGFQHLRTGLALLPDSEVHGHTLGITACGPAASDVADAQIALCLFLESQAKGGSAIRRIDPNLTSGALLLRWGEARVLLAGDLLRGKDDGSGWRHCRAAVDDGLVHVVNVAHHASEGAHDPDLWERMKPNLAIVTPFQRAVQSQPPRPDQILTLAEHSIVAITAPPDWLNHAAAGQPQPAHALPRPPELGLPASAPPSVAASDSATDRHNAVAVSLNSAGDICRLVLAGKADLYA